MSDRHFLPMPLLAAAAAACLLAGAAAQARPVFSNIYVLGDSLSDQGNLFDATQALRGVGIPDPSHYVDGRFSNGEVYSGLLAQRLGLTLSSTSRGGNNFAYAGTRTDYNIVEAPKPGSSFDPGDPGGLAAGAYPWTLNLQRQAFVNRRVHDPNALYVVFSGSNDVSDLLKGQAPSGSAGAVIGNVVQGIYDVVSAFKDAGARYVLVPLVPDLGVVPAVVANGPRAIAGGTALSRSYNAALQTKLSDAVFKDMTIIWFDTFSFVDQVHDRPADFGFTNVNQGCYSGFVDPSPTATECASPNSFAYWDREHPTTALHGILADRMVATLDRALPEPGSAALVLGALGALGLARRRRDGAAAAAG